MSHHPDVSDTESGLLTPDPIPRYLQAHYWWAYVHPNAVWLFERAWLADLILWHNYRGLSEAALTALAAAGTNGQLPGRTLQIACVYGDLTERLARHAPPATAASMSWTCCPSSWRIWPASCRAPRRFA